MDFEVRHVDGTTVKLISSEHKCAITSATQTRKLCGNDTVTINLQSATYIEFQVGDKITIFGTTYTLNQLPTVKKESERSYTYTLVFEGLQYTLIDRVFLMPDNTQGDNLMFDLAGMLDVLDDNINRGNSGKQYVFELDESLEETEYKNLSLTGKNCLQVLQQLCQEWDTEFVFAEEPTRIAIYIGVAGSTFPTTFKYGRGGGVYELNREKGASDICTRLFVYGGTQNLTYYRHNRLCLPSKEKNQSYVEDATAQAVYGIKEQVKNFDDIYPNRIGTITSLSGCDYNEFIDSAMADAEFGFDLNEKWANNADDCAEWLALKGLENTEANRTIYYNDVAGTATKYLMAGATAKIHFNTGALAGYECDLHSYTHSSQKFVLKPLVDENGYDFPSKTNAAFKLAVGDEYVILDINLPTAYKTQAESKLATEAASYFDTVCRPQPKYTLTIEPIALKHIVGPSTADTEIFKVGDLINISDPTGGVESATIRIDQFVRNLLDPFDYKLTLTDEITYSQQVRTLIEVDAIKRVVEESKIYDVNRIRRGWKDAEELYNQMFDTEGHYYSEKIAPLSIDTQMLKVGARSQQLVLQNVLFQPNYNANPANLQISAGSLVHYTIAEPDIKTWTMSALSASNVPSTAQYVYAKCAKNGTTGTWLVTDEAIVFDSELYPNDYHFLVGSLSSVDSVSNTRNFAATYGFTTINGRNITTGVIKSADGSGVIIDLDAGIIKGNITFESGTTSYDALQGIISGNDTVQGAATTANRAEGKIDGLEIGGRNLLLDSDRVLENGSLTDTRSVFRVMIGTNTDKDFNAGITTWYYYETGFNTTGRKSVTFAIGSASTAPYIFVKHNGSQRDFGLWFDNPNTIEAGTYTLSFDIIGYNPNVANGLVVKNFKLEKGNKATDYTPAPEDTEAELTALQSDLQGQIDSKIETWSQSADPSTAWTTTALKDKHEGDLWQYTGTTTSTRTQNATYRWSGSAWVEQKASSELFDKIDGKTAIWYGSPSDHPAQGETVEEDDYLVDGTTGTTYKYAPNITPNTNGWVTLQDYQTAIANIQIGGANIARATENITIGNSSHRDWQYSEIGVGGVGTGTRSVIAKTNNTPAKTDVVQIAQTSTSSGECSIAQTNITKMVIGETYILSCYAKATSGSPNLYLQLDAQTKVVAVTSSWVRYSLTAIHAADQTGRWFIGSYNSNGTLQICGLKLEKGNKATDWSPAPEDGDAEARARIANIDSDSVFSMAEKQAFRPEWYAISGIANTTSGMQSGGSALTHYTSISTTAVNTRGALNTAFNRLRLYLKAFELYINTDRGTAATTETYDGTTVVSAGDAFSKTTLSSLLAAYYKAELDIEAYAENVVNLKATCSTASGRDKDVICPELTADMLTDPNMRMTIKFDYENINSRPRITFRNTEGGSYIYPSNATDGTNNSKQHASFYYEGKSAFDNNSTLYWIADQEIELKFNSQVSPSSGGGTNLPLFEMTDENNFRTIMSYSKAIKGKTDIIGGLILTQMIQAGEGGEQAGICGFGNVAFWAGGSEGAAEIFGVPVVIMRDGNAKFGVLRIDRNGKITMEDETGNSSALAIFNGDVSTPPTDQDNITNKTSSSTAVSLAYQTYSGTVYASGGTGSLVSIPVQSSLAAKHNGMKVHVKNASVKVYSSQGVWSYYTAEVVTGVNRSDILFDSYNGATDQTKTESADRTYTFENGGDGYESIGFNIIGNGFHSGIRVDYSFDIAWYHDATTQKVEIGNNGLISFRNLSNYFRAYTDPNTDAFVTTIKGNTDIPGVLWAGSISSGAVATPHYKNSAKYASNQLACDTWNSTNKYFRITHRLGSANFAAMVTPSSSEVTVRTTKDSTYLYVYLSAQASFDLVLFGTN